MKSLKSIYFMTFFIVSSCTFGQHNNDRLLLGKTHVNQGLANTLSAKKQHNVIDNKSIIIKDSITAINVAEPILFSTYGKENIVKHRPYETYYINDYWGINGIFPKTYVGGKFLIIIDSRDSKVLRITHCK